MTIWWLIEGTDCLNYLVLPRHKLKTCQKFHLIRSYFCLQTSGSQVCMSNHAQVNSYPIKMLHKHIAVLLENILNSVKSLIKLSMVDGNEKYYKMKKNIFLI